MPVYLELFHGRRKKKEKLQDWGEDGPILGPFEYVHTTYGCHVHCGDKDNDNIDLMIHDGMVYYGGMYYGDWSVFSNDVLDKDTKLLARLQKIKEIKTLTPSQKAERRRQGTVSWK